MSSVVERPNVELWLEATAVLPLYLGALGLGMATLGLMEGAADLAFSPSRARHP